MSVSFLELDAFAGSWLSWVSRASLDSVSWIRDSIVSSSRCSLNESFRLGPAGAAVTGAEDCALARVCLPAPPLAPPAITCERHCSHCERLAKDWIFTRSPGCDSVGG